MQSTEESLLGVAISAAAEAHMDQRDKRGEPYILHPLRIVLALRAAGYSETHQCAAALHDCVEDTSMTLVQVRENFGSTIAEAVDALTRRGNLRMTPEKEWIWTETYKEYIVRCCQNLIARTVKRFDVYDNFDPRRYCEGVPTGRYTWTLDYLQSLDQLDRDRAEHGIVG